MVRNKKDDLSKGSSIIILVYLISSFFGALIFSIIANRAKSKGKKYIVWLILSFVFMILFGILSYALFKTSSTEKDALYYWIGLGSLVTNSISLILNILTIRK